MIELSNGYKFLFQCGSGALAFDGRGWWWEHPLRWFNIIDTSQFAVVAKTVTLSPRKGNLSMLHPWTCVKLLEHGVVNAVGISNPGIEIWTQKYYPRAESIAASIMADSWEDAFTLGVYLQPLKLNFIELNVSCPNTNQGDRVYKVIKGLRTACYHPIIVKLSYEQANDQYLLEMLNDTLGVEAIHAINTVPWDDIFHNKTSPVEKYTGSKGGVSGRYIHEHARTAVKNIKKYAPNKQIVAGGGIESIQEVKNFQEDGADGFSMGTLFLRKPWKPNQIIGDYIKP